MQMAKLDASILERKDYQFCRRELSEPKYLGDSSELGHVIQEAKEVFAQVIEGLWQLLQQPLHAINIYANKCNEKRTGAHCKVDADLG